MTIRYRKWSKELEQIKQSIVSLSLSHTIEQDHSIQIPFIQTGKIKHEGYFQMKTYIDVLESEKEQWYYCDC